MEKKIRQYIGLLVSVFIYYLIHEGAHLLYALWIGCFKSINFIGLGIQVDVFAEKMSSYQMGIFCIVGSLATLLVAYLLVVFTNAIGKSVSKVYKACMYYTVLVLLFVDPLYLSVLCGLFGGGDMNGISLLISPLYGHLLYAFIFVGNGFVFYKYVYPKYVGMFKEE